MCDTHYDVAQLLDIKGVRFQEHSAMKIAKTKNWADYLDDQTYVLTDKASYADLEMYGLYVAKDSQVTFKIDAPSPGKKYSWFVSKTCEATFEYDLNWNPEMVETVYYEPIE